MRKKILPRVSSTIFRQMVNRVRVNKEERTTSASFFVTFRFIPQSILFCRNFIRDPKNCGAANTYVFFTENNNAQHEKLTKYQTLLVETNSVKKYLCTGKHHHTSTMRIADWQVATKSGDYLFSYLFLVKKS